MAHSQHALEVHDVIIALWGYASSVRRAALLSLFVAACDSYSEGAPPPPEPGIDAGHTANGPLCTGGAIHVSASSGNDANEGCDPAKPKKTLVSALGHAQAKKAVGTEIRTCVETIRERVVVAFPASIIGGFDCATWAPGPPDAKTTIEAPPDAIEALIALGGPDYGTTRLERLRFVGAARSAGAVTGLRVKDGAAPDDRNFSVAGGSTQEGIAVAVAIENASPTLEDGIIEGGSAKCTADCKGVIASGVTVNGGNPRLRRLRITGGTADVPATGNYIGSYALDVVGPAKAVDADAFSELEIVHGVGRVGGLQPAWGMRIANAEIDLVDSKILPGPVPSTCVAGECRTIGILAEGTASARVRRSRVLTTDLEGAPGTTGVSTAYYAYFASNGGKLEVSSSFGFSNSVGLGVTSGSLSFLGSTVIGSSIVANNGGTLDVKSSVLGLQKVGLGFYSSACTKPAKTALESSVIIGATPVFADFLVPDQGTCTGTGATQTLAATVAKSDANNTFTAASMLRVTTSCSGEDAGTCIERAACNSNRAACLGEVMSSIAPLDGFLLKDGVPCSVAHNGIALPSAAEDAFKKMRSAPFSMGAHEYDGACTP